VNIGDFWAYFRWLVVQSFGFALFPPVQYTLLALGLGFIVSAAWQKPYRPSLWRTRYWLIFTQLLFVPALAVIGTLYRVILDPTKPLPKENAVANWSINILVLLSLGLSFFWVYRMKGIRWFAFCVLAIQEVFVLGAMFIAGMSISGDWI
jgi:hypothetical protein